ncbi:MAG: DUF2378 family protein [Myxococcaceae bacterium]|nr:DUF2378 family protein [Myxococcaceae bacterium]
MSGDRPIPGKLVKGVFQRVLFADLSAELIAALAGAGLDLSVPVQEAYPRPVWYRSIELTADSLFPDGDQASRLRRLGRHVIEVLEARKLLKGPWLSMAKLMGPRRALKQAAEMGGQYSPVQLDVRERSSRELEVTVAEDQQAEFLAGLLEGLVGVLGGKAPAVRVESAGNGRAVMAASWR